MNSHEISFYIDKKPREGEIGSDSWFSCGNKCTSKRAVCFANRILQVRDNLEVVARQNAG
jgi:hypothetical protein